MTASGVQRAIARTPEWIRVNALPRRAPFEASPEFCEAVSARLRRPGSRAVLRPIQVWALLEIWRHRGLLGPIRVGQGKTLIFLLAPVVLQSLRPVGLLPAKLVEKTNREMRELSRDWLIPNHLRLMSYELLGRITGAQQLEAWQPDLIVTDESHKLKNPDAAVTRRVRRLMGAHPETPFVALSGTITKRSIKDYAHLAGWALKPAGMPLPCNYRELTEWADALDESYRGERPFPGALCAWSIGQSARLEDVREGYGRRLAETPGVVISPARDADCDASLDMAAVQLPESDAGNAAFEALRLSWELPDGYPLVDGPSIWRAARQLALGFFYVWDPRPPDAWLDARKVWSQWARHILSDNGRQLDSRAQVERATVEGHYPAALQAFNDWKKIEPTFRANTVPVWLDTLALDKAAEWAASHRGIVWTEQVAFAERLAKHACLRYYGREGRDAAGRPVDSHTKGDGSCVASSASCRDGFNLQHCFSENLETSPAPNGLQWEQKIGRTHRLGQTADAVTWDVFFGCQEHEEAWDATLADARYVRASTGHEQKILLATTTMTASAPRGGPRWDKDFFR